MTNKKIIIDDIDVNALCSDEIACMNRYEVARLFIKTVERLVTKEQENEELRQYHNKCCEENTKKLEEWLEKYNQISRDFHNGKYCNEENCNLLKAKEQECEELKRDLHKNFEEKDKLHLIIDRLLEASGYDTNTASAEDFEDVYENMRYEKQQLDQLKAENKELKQYKTLYEKTRNLWNKARMNNYELLDEIKDLKDSLKRTVCQSECYKHKEADKLKQTLVEIKEIIKQGVKIHDDIIVSKQILQKISECEVENA